MTEGLDVAVLGAHHVPGVGPTPPPDEHWFDAVDLALRMSDGRVVALGVRCGSYLTSPDEANRAWGSYIPLAVTLDLARVAHWDFNQVMWLGPEAWPCLVWSNAERLTVRSLDVLLAPDRRDRLLIGPEGRGLPSIDEVGRSLPTGTEFRPIGPSPLVGTVEPADGF